MTSALTAQHPFEVTPAAGAYIPTGKMFDEFQSGCSCHSTIAQLSGFLLGVHLGFGAESRVTIETTLDFGSSGVQMAQPGQPVMTTSGTVVIVGARLRLNARQGAVTTPYLSGGAAYLSHASDAYHNVSWNNGAAISLGVGLRVVVNPYVVGRIDVEDYHYNVTVGPTTPTQHDNDLLLSLGIGVTP